MCYIGLGIILVLATLIALVAWGINTIDEKPRSKPRFSEPKVIAKYEPHPRPMNLKVTDEMKERAQYEVISRITE